MCIEVKPNANHRLKKNQYEIMKALSRYGVPCYKWTPDKGLVRITEGYKYPDKG